MLSKVTTEPMERRQLLLTVEVDQGRVDQELRKAAEKLAREQRIPGFRKGKAPYAMVKQYVGLPNLFKEFVEKLGHEVYLAAIEQEQIEPYAIAALDVASLAPLTYTFAVPLDPQIDLGDYRSLRVAEETPEVDESEIEARLESYRTKHSSWRSVSRPSLYGDTMTIDVRSILMPEDGEESDVVTVVLDEVDWDVTPDDDNPMEPPGFDAALLGLSAGEEADFQLSWPEESQSIYAGRSAQFHVVVKDIRAYAMPDLNDEFTQLVGSDFKTLDDLKANIREDLLKQKKANAENDYLTKALDALLEQSSMEYPPVVVEDQLDVMLRQLEQELHRYGVENPDRYFERIGQSKEEYRESMREQAEVIARRNLIISELYRREGIEITDDDIEARIAEMIGESDDAATAETQAAFAETMRQGAGRSYLESQLLQTKTLERFLAIVRGEEVPPPASNGGAQSGAEEPVAQAEEIVQEGAGNGGDDVSVEPELNPPAQP